ncbi:MAG: YceI family protein [Sporocytophaga sp.]|uniref:YceI family protein n=1 Tax=Sporocytophaga sp. TaxID=2231183 RepID=UPI001B23B3C1|nr:YceI family protein [Sporocytophaga sp.]MBO9703385.1 YceI family protein [Sporocytophaga sp.]
MAKWILDPVHSEIGFKVKHLMINNVKGHFKSFASEVETSSDDFKGAKINFSADLSSIDTGNEQRDGHLKSADFFNAEKHPQLIFTGKKFDGSTLEGDLSIAGITKPVKLNVEFGGVAKDPWGNTKAGFTVTGKINRKDWGINWNATLETGGFLVSDEVAITAEVQYQQQA